MNALAVSTLILNTSMALNQAAHILRQAQIEGRDVTDDELASIDLEWSVEIANLKAEIAKKKVDQAG